MTPFRNPLGGHPVIGRVTGAWDWFVAGLAEALVHCRDFRRREAPYRIEIGGDEVAVLAPDGSRIGTAGRSDDQPFDPPVLAKRLAGAAIDIAVPNAWIFQRDLEPVARQSLPFLDAFVRHHIERITPWRPADVLYDVRQGTVEGDAARVAIEIGVVPKRLVGRWIATVEALRPRAMAIVPREATNAQVMTIPLGREAASQRSGALSRRIAFSLVALSLGFAGLLGWILWQSAQVQEEIDAQDSVINERKAFLARAEQRATAGGAQDKLRTLFSERTRAVDVIEALSAALPDTAHLTKFDLDKDHLTIAGITSAMPQLVPALETSGRFADVAFGAPTTKVEDGAGDRFQLDMRVAPADKGGIP